MNAPQPCDVLILSASYGAGHNQAARAIAGELQQSYTGLRVKIYDFFALAAPRINRFTQACFIKMVSHFPPCYRWFYDLTCTIEHDSSIQRWINSLGHRRLLDLLYTYNPRVIVCTFPTPAGVLLALREKGVPVPPIVTVITDVAIHNQWVNPHTQAYIVPDESMVSGLVEKDVSIDNIYPLGIPLRNSFNRLKPPAESRAIFGLRNDLFTVLIMGGAYGMMKGVTGICKALGNYSSGLQIAVVCGHNRLLLERLRKMEGSLANPMPAFGYVENIGDLMNVSDVLVSKAGGITVYESLAMGLPLLVYRPIPGQEEGNTRFLERIGAGKAISSTENLVDSVLNLKNNSLALETMRSSALVHAKPNAAGDAAALIMDLALPSGYRQTDHLFAAQMA